MINAVLGHFRTVKERERHAVQSNRRAKKHRKMVIKAKVIHLLIS